MRMFMGACFCPTANVLSLPRVLCTEYLKRYYAQSSPEVPQQPLTGFNEFGIIGNHWESFETDRTQYQLINVYSTE